MAELLDALFDEDGEIDLSSERLNVDWVNVDGKMIAAACFTHPIWYKGARGVLVTEGLADKYNTEVKQESYVYSIIPEKETLPESYSVLETLAANLAKKGFPVVFSDDKSYRRLEYVSN